MNISKYYCNFCGARIMTPLSKDGADYGLIPLNGSGRVLYSFDACSSCKKGVIAAIEEYKTQMRTKMGQGLDPKKEET